MFYSQFILAKKGPLGTIWIAAHLERKLRKNQVADTDIGVSVDSILSPDVPIALRLSSHLLLGVVRIYNRKVNYLFDDCSEALLKVKQAFRSTDVDLPPEESKAPYHSITLPETFDLDDFELPDNDIFQGNYVDHHISSREQITLQDTMEGVSYSTSKFGLDERFGDGDASGLDLDEELLLDRFGSVVHANESAGPQASVGSMSPLKEDEHPVDRATNSEPTVDRVDDDLMDYAHAPCTPGLVEEPNLSNVQEASACDDHLEIEEHLESPIKVIAKDVSYEDKTEAHWCSREDTGLDATIVKVPVENNHLEIKESEAHGEPSLEAKAEFVPLKESSLSEPVGNILCQVEAVNSAAGLPNNTVTASEAPSQNDIKDDVMQENSTCATSANEHHGDHQGSIQIGVKNSLDTDGATTNCQKVAEDVSAKDPSSFGLEVSCGMENVNIQQKSRPGVMELAPENQNGIGIIMENSEIQACHETTEPGASNIDAHDKEASGEAPFLRPCNITKEKSDLSGCSMSLDVDNDNAVLASPEREKTADLGKVHSITGNSEQTLPENQEPGPTEVHQSPYSDPDGQVKSTNSDEGLAEKLNNSMEAELSAPEKLLSVPEGQGNLHKDMSAEFRPREFEGIDENDGGSKTFTGKKRSFTESTLTEQSLNSVESSRLVRAKRITDSVPDDDDLLSSILVGRASSILKVKPTPRLSEVTSTKRTRSAARSVAPKRKVVMDDTMVLHGDTIRQQLTSTEDIRRVRKKAPCTRSEISMMQKQHLEDESFLEPLFTGMCTELASLHHQVFDLSQIKVIQNDLRGASLEIGAEPWLTSQDGENGVSNGIEGELKIAPDSDSKDIDIGEPQLKSQSNEICETHVIESIEGMEKTGEMGVMSELSAKDNEMAKPSENPLLSENRLEEDCMNTDAIPSHEQTNPTEDVGPDVSQQGLLVDVAGVETSPKRATEVESLGSIEHSTADTGNGSAGMAQIAPLNEIDATTALMSSDPTAITGSDPLGASPYREIDALSVELARVDFDDGQAIDGHKVTEYDNGVNGEAETETGVRDSIMSDVVQDGATADVVRNAELGGLDYYDQNEINKVTPEEQHAEVSVLENGSTNNDENAEHLEAYQPNFTETEIYGSDLHERDELNYSTAGNDTEFLNVDDDELSEMADDGMPDVDETRLNENSGWSSRTRAVSKYLQTAFVKEAECGRNSLSLDNLLAGKSRKEASRMFFEALVLKTKDYIDVEQQQPFGDISIKPRKKLMKSDF